MITENLNSSINTMFLRKHRYYQHKTQLKFSPQISESVIWSSPSNTQTPDWTDYKNETSQGYPHISIPRVHGTDIEVWKGYSKNVAGTHQKWCQKYDWTQPEENITSNWQGQYWQPGQGWPGQCWILPTPSDDKWKEELLNELVDARSNLLDIEGFDSEELNTILEHICVSWHLVFWHLPLSIFRGFLGALPFHPNQIIQ